MRTDHPPVAEQASRPVIIGRVSGVFGVRGWIRIWSYTSPRLNIVNYSPWNLRLDGVTSRYELVEGREHGEGIVARLAGVDDRDAAAALMGADIEIGRDRLAAPGSDEFYWTDLEGMEVMTPAGEVLGVVDHLFETGANDVMVVVGKRRLLIPFIYGRVILAVDTQRRVITADWHDDA